MSGLNVIDCFAGRDLAQDGSGRDLASLPLWLLLHDLHRNRVLVELRRHTRLTSLPASRDTTGASRVVRTTLTSAADGAALARTIADAVAGPGGAAAADEVILWGPSDRAATVATHLDGLLAGRSVRRLADLAVDDPALTAATVAVLGLLHLDQIPGNLPAITKARAPRVLGRLTPGSLANWHRLLRELASRAPSVVTLRSAV
jgi:1,6-anhydro-N-acetylmuramate kinase